MARTIEVIRKTLHHLSDVVDVYTTTMKRAPATEDYKAPIDIIINKWAQKRRTLINAIYKEEGARYIDFVDDQGKKCQIAIEKPAPRAHEFGLRAWDLRSKRKDFTTDMETLSQRLDEAFSHIQRWLHHS